MSDHAPDLPAAARLAVRAYHTETAYKLAEFIIRCRMLDRIVGDDVDAALEVAREVDGGAEAAEAESKEMPEEERVQLIGAVRARVTEVMGMAAVEIASAYRLLGGKPDTLDGFPAEPAAVLGTVLYMAGRQVDGVKRMDA